MQERRMGNNFLFGRRKRLCSSLEVDRILTKNGILTIDDVFNSGLPLQGSLKKLGNRHDNRDVRRLTIKDGSVEIHLYIKRQWRPTRYIPRTIDIRTGLWRSTPVNEWRGLHLLRGIGLNTAEPWALFQGVLTDARSAIIIRALPVSSSLDFLLREDAALLRETGGVEMLSRNIVQIFMQLFSANLTWRSATAKHIYPEKIDSQNWKLWLLDCEGVHANISSKDKRRCVRNFIESVSKVDAEGYFTEKLCADLSLIDCRKNS
jgi:hypothetical protein